MVTVQGGKGMETQNSVLYLLDTLQLTQEKEKSSVVKCSTGDSKKIS